MEKSKYIEKAKDRENEKEKDKGKSAKAKSIRKESYRRSSRSSSSKRHIKCAPIPRKDECESSDDVGGFNLAEELEEDLSQPAATTRA